VHSNQNNIPALCVCVRAACGASATSEKHVPGFRHMCFVHLMMFCDFKPPWYFSSYGSKTRIEILCKRRAPLLTIFLSKHHFSCNSWNCRTLARMSTLAKQLWLQNCQPLPNSVRQHLSIPPHPCPKGGRVLSHPEYSLVGGNHPKASTPLNDNTPFQKNRPVLLGEPLVTFCRYICKRCLLT